MNSKINNLDDLYNYIDSHNIQNIDIRFLDKDYIIRVFTINAKSLSAHFFIKNYFNFGQYKLLPLSLDRLCKDPFLPHPTLIFFTNIIDDIHKVQLLEETPYDQPYKTNFALINNPNIGDAYNFCCPPLDYSRNIRDEICLVASKVGITIVSSFYKELEENIITFKFKNYLDLLDCIEKLKYIILMVGFVYNQEINTDKGIFKISSILKD